MATHPRDSLLKEIQAGYFGDFLVAKGLIQAEQLKIGLAQQSAKTSFLRIGEILVKLGFLDSDALVPALKEFKAQLRLGELLISTGQIRFLQLLDALDEQRKSGETIGQVVVKLGFCTQDRVEEALEIQRTVYAE